MIATDDAVLIEWPASLVVRRYTRSTHFVMKCRRNLASGLLFGAFALPSFPKDLLFVSTNWNEPGREQVLVIDPESGQSRILWAGGAELDAVVSPDGARLYVNYIDVGKGDGLAVVDIATGAVLQRVETPQLIRWIFPSHPAMAVSPDGRWLYLLKTNYAAGSYDFFLVTFDTRKGGFLSGERAISSCPGSRILPVPGEVTALVLCGGRNAIGLTGEDSVLRFQNFVYGQLDPMGRMLYVAGHDGRIRAVDLVTHEITQTSKDAPLRYRRIIPSSGSMSPDGRLWYLPIKIPGNGEQEIEQILVFDTQAMSMASVITPVGPFSGLALSADGRRLYASQSDLHSIMVIDTETRRIRTVVVGAKPSILFVVKAP